MRVSAAVLAIAAVTTALLAVPAPASGADRKSAGKGFTSIFPKPPFQGSGWAACAAPIVWHADVHALEPRAQVNALDDLRTAFGTWAASSRMAMVHGDDIPMSYDDINSVVRPAQGPALPRNIYVAFVPDENSTYMSNRVGGVATPTKVIIENKEIIGGSAAFRADYVNYSNQAESVALFLHELGHVLGLGHVNVKTNVMYPIVTRTARLGVGDTTGMKTFTRPCDHNFDTQRGIG